MVKIALLVEAETGVPLWQLQGYDRRLRMGWVRQGLMLILSEAGFTLSAIGRFMRRDHTTVSHGLSSARALRNTSDTRAVRTLAMLDRARDVAALGENHAD